MGEEPEGFNLKKLDSPFVAVNRTSRTFRQSSQDVLSCLFRHIWHGGISEIEELGHIRSHVGGSHSECYVVEGDRDTSSLTLRPTITKMTIRRRKIARCKKHMG
jgi:hypothetical protein